MVTRLCRPAVSVRPLCVPLRAAAEDAPAAGDSIKLYCGNLSWDTRRDDLEELFSKFGQVRCGRGTPLPAQMPQGPHRQGPQQLAWVLYYLLLKTCNALLLLYLPGLAYTCVDACERPPPPAVCFPLSLHSSG